MLSLIFIRTKAGSFIAAVLVALILAGCSGRTPETEAPLVIEVEANTHSDYYLQQMQQSSNNNKADWQLLVISALLNERKIPQAAEQLATLPKKLSETQRQEQQLLTAELLIIQNNNTAASEIINTLDPGKLSFNQRGRYYQAQIDTEKKQPTLRLIRAYIAQEPLLTDKKAHQENIDNTWQALTQFTPAQFNNLVINADENLLQGWFDLVHIYQDNQQNPDLLQAGIREWQARYPQNPAAQTLPTQLSSRLNFTPTSTANIALLLPLSGPAKRFGEAIQQGFMAAQHGLPKATQTPSTLPANLDAENTLWDEDSPSIVTSESSTSTPVNLKTHVRVYDTETQSIAALLTQVQQDGATLVVGPLLKPAVEQLSTLSTPLDILALNQPEGDKDSPNICYFALSPEDEARDAALHMWQQQKQAPLLITPRGMFGDRIAKAFTKEWYKQGGSTVLQQPFGSTTELKQAINSGKGLNLTGQPVSDVPLVAAESVTIAGVNIPAPPIDTPMVTTSATRGSVDAVYIVATPGEMTLIKPMIDMATHSLTKPTLFASSRSNQATTSPDYRLEMEGVQFSDIPLIAGTHPELMKQAIAKYGNDYSLIRLYAMGIDAWELASHFDAMRHIPGFQLSGSTGDLSISSDCVINRTLPWLQYHQGRLIPVR